MLKVVIIIFCLILTACKVGPSYQTPQFSVPTHWQTGNCKLSDHRDGSGYWWRTFNDPVLERLICQAINNNLDVKIACARVKEARAQALASYANLFPSINASVLGASTNLGFLTLNKKINFFQPEFDATWEMDLFGGNRRKLESRQAYVQVSQALQQEVFISLVSEVARNYVELRRYQAQLSLAQKKVAALSEGYQLQLSLTKANIIREGDNLKARVLVDEAESAISSIISAIAACNNHLALLLGEAPGCLDNLIAAEHIPAAQGAVLLSEPITVITQRPDVKAAERELAAITAQQGVAVASAFPKVNILSFFGLQKSNLFPGIKTYLIGGRIVQPLIDFGKIKAQICIANAQQEQAFYNYKKSILTALEEVETNITRYVNGGERLGSLLQARNSLKLAMDVSSERYKKGVESYAAVINNRVRFYDLELVTINAKADLAEYIISLYKSLGGCQNYGM